MNEITDVFYHVKPEIIEEIRQKKGKSNRGRKSISGEGYWLYQFKSSRDWLESLGYSSERSYNFYLRNFCWYHKKTPDDLIRLELREKSIITEEMISNLTTMPKTENQKLVEMYAKHLREIAVQEVSKAKCGRICVNSVDDYLNGIRSYFNFSSIKINWKTITIPKELPSPFRAYMDEEYEIILKNCKNDRERLILMLMGAAGIRVGVSSRNNPNGTEGITLGHCFPLIKDTDGNILQVGEIELDGILTGCAGIMCYPDSKSYFYPTFLIPQLRDTLNAYLQFRRNCGERLRPASPLVREIFEDGSPNTNKPRFVGTCNINHLVRKIAKNGKDQVDLHDIQPDHGLRKRYNNRIENSGLKDTTARLLFGHIGKDLQLKVYHDHDYRKPEHRKNMLDSLREFQKAIDNLTIGEEYKLKKKMSILEKQQEEQPNVEILSNQVETMRLQIEQNKREQKLQRQQNNRDQKWVIRTQNRMVKLIQDFSEMIAYGEDKSYKAVTEKENEKIRKKFVKITKESTQFLST